MAQTLDQFIQEVKEALVTFEANYRKQNEEYPEECPLELPDDNKGLWWEFFCDDNR